MEDESKYYCNTLLALLFCLRLGQTQDLQIWKEAGEETQQIYEKGNMYFNHLFIEKLYLPLFQGCTCDHSGQTSSKPWCSTKVDSSGRHLAGHWGICGDNCTESSFDCKYRY